MSVSEDRIYELINHAECGAIASSIITAIYEATQAERARCLSLTNGAVDECHDYDLSGIVTHIASLISGGDPT